MENGCVISNGVMTNGTHIAMSDSQKSSAAASIYAKAYKDIRTCSQLKVVRWVREFDHLVDSQIISFNIYQYQFLRSKVELEVLAAISWISSFWVEIL